jgi:hypothetical protein
LTNPLAEPVMITSIVVKGPPVAVTREGEARVVGPRFDANGAEDVERRLADSVYTQNEADAERRARLAVLFEGPPRPVYRGLECPYSPGVNLGMYARYFSQRLSITDLPVVVVGKELVDSGRRMLLDVASVAGLRKLSELWVVGQSYADADQRRMGL